MKTSKTVYAIQVWSPDTNQFVDPYEPRFETMTEALLSAETWYPTQRIDVKPEQWDGVRPLATLG